MMKKTTIAALGLLLAAVPALSAPRIKPLELDEVLRVAGKIDELLAKDLKAKGLAPLPVVSDELFLRRAYVSIVGRIPTAQEAARFLDNESADKRARLIEELVASPGYDSAAFNYFADLLRLPVLREQLE